MDQELEKKIEEARAAGYTDEQINEYIQSLNQPTVIAKEQPMDRGEETWGLGEGMVAKGLETAAGLYGGKKFIIDPALEAIRGRNVTGPVAPSAPSQPSVSAPTNPTIPNYGGSGAGVPNIQASPTASAPTVRQPISEPTRPIAPTSEPVLNETWDKALRATPKTGAPSTPAVRESIGMRNMPGQATAGTAATGVMARGIDYANKIRELAAQKALQAAPYAAKGGVAATLMSIPSSIGVKVPEVGPLRGSEINPQTGRGWTDEELARYNAQYNR